MDSIYLVGSEDVKNAAHRVSEAAGQMKEAASNIRYAFEMNQQFMEQWLVDFRDALTPPNLEAALSVPDALQSAELELRGIPAVSTVHAKVLKAMRDLGVREK